MANGQPTLPDIFNANCHYLNLLINTKPEAFVTAKSYGMRVEKQCDKVEELLAKFEEPPSNITRINR